MCGRQGLHDGLAQSLSPRQLDAGTDVPASNVRAALMLTNAVLSDSFQHPLRMFLYFYIHFALTLH